MTHIQLYTFGKGSTYHVSVPRSNKPHLFDAFEHVNIQSVALGAKHGALLTDSEKLYTFGRGDHGVLGTGETTSPQSPQWVLTFRTIEVVKIDCGGYHTACITKNHDLYVWGSNSHYQLGTGDLACSEILTPRKLELRVRPKEVFCGPKQTAIITEHDTVYSWGSNREYQLAHYSKEVIKQPQLLETHEEKIVQISFGYEHALYRTAKCDLFVAGTSSRGQCGIPGKKTFSTLTPIPTTQNLVLGISCGAYHSLAIFQEDTSLISKVMAWGDNRRGQLGLGDTDQRNSPQEVQFLRSKYPYLISCGTYHSLCATNHGLYSWGSDKQTLGHKGPSKSHCDYPQLVGFDEEGTIFRIFSNSHFNCVLYLPGQTQTSESRKLAIGPQITNTPANSLSIFIGSWNVNAKIPYGNQLRSWLQSPCLLPPDVYAIGIQEIVPLNTKGATQSTYDRLKVARDVILEEKAKLLNKNNFDKLYLEQTTELHHHLININLSTHDHETKRKVVGTWKSLLEETINSQDLCKYTYIKAKKLFGLVLFIFVRSNLSEYTRDVMTDKLGVGLMGSMANKGAAAIRLTVLETPLCFVSSHLAAGASKIAERNLEVEKISTKMRFGSKTLHDHELFWFGDMNYRLSCTRQEAVQMLERIEENRAKILAHDQLSVEIHAGRAFKGYEEGELPMCPTYKYDPGTNVFDSSEKQRVPSWCDRILWRSMNWSDNRIIQSPNSYRVHSNILFSDHLPISACFHVRTVNPVPESIRIQPSQYHQRLINKPLPPIPYSKLSNESSSSSLTARYTSSVIVSSPQVKLASSAMTSPSTPSFSKNPQGVPLPSPSPHTGTPLVPAGHGVNSFPCLNATPGSVNSNPTLKTSSQDSPASLNRMYQPIRDKKQIPKKNSLASLSFDLPNP